MQSPTQSNSTEASDTCISVSTADSDAEPGFPREASELRDVVSTAIGYIWGPVYFPDAFISDGRSAVVMLPTHGIRLFNDASVDVMGQHPQEGRVLCCAYFKCKSYLHKLAFDASLEPEKIRMLEEIRLYYLEHVGEWEIADLNSYWEGLVVSLYPVVTVECV
jgi:hypothetical protein